MSASTTVTPREHRWTEGERLTLDLVATLELGPVMASVYRLSNRGAPAPYCVRAHRVIGLAEGGYQQRISREATAQSEDEGLAVARAIFARLAALAPMPDPAPAPTGVQS